MKAVLFAVLLGIAAIASAAPYSCPPSLGPSQLGCTFTSTGGTTTYTANVSAQATRGGLKPPASSFIGLQVSLDALTCFSNFDTPVPIVTTANANGSCTFEVSSKRPVDLIAVAQYFNATPTYIALVANSVAFVPDNSLSVAIVGAGTVTSSDGGINCGSDCSESYSPATTVTLSAAAAPGSVFSGWSGACGGTTPTCTLRVSESRAVTANFDYVTSPPAVEFHNAVSNRYFMTADPNEVATIENGGAGPGWSRTGLFFKTGGNTAVCRFYGSLSPGPNSHFYTALVEECNFLKQVQAATPSSRPRWNFEGLAFSTILPAAGICPAGTLPVYRAYNNGFLQGVDSNHRFTTSANALQQVLAQGWKYEGVAMCSPQ